MIGLLVLVVAVAIILEVRSLNRSLGDVSYHMEPSARSVELGEEFQLKTTIDNVSNYNLSYLYVEEAIPAEVEILDREKMELGQREKHWLHKSILFMKRRERLRRNMRVRINRRGIVKFQYTKVKFGDLLGIKELAKAFHYNRSVVVYPISLRDERLEQVLSDVMGNVSVNSFLYEDPILVKGYRDYTGREPLRSISFPMSAKRNQLTVKEFDHTREEMVDLIFDVSYKGEFDHYFNQQEAMFSMVRAICERFEQKGISYRLITNAYYAAMDVHGVNVIQSGGTGGHGITKILEVLGTASNAAMCETEELLSETFRKFSQEKTFVYLCQRREETTETQLAVLERRFGVTLYRMYGEDFEESYLDAIRGREEKAG